MSFAIQSFGDPQKPPLLFLHGFMGSSADWDFFLKPLSEYFHCHLLDLPGHGATPAAASIDHRHLIQQLGQLIATFKRPVSLIAYSMGARVALELLLTHQESIAAAIIESANPGIADYLARNKRLRDDLNLLQNIHCQQDLEDFLSSWYQQEIFCDLPTHENFPQLLDKNYTSVQGWKKSLAILSIGCQPNLWPRLGSLKTPLLYIHGAKDRKYSAIATKLAQASPWVTQYTFQHAGHNTHFANPQKFLAVALNFLTHLELNIL